MGLKSQASFPFIPFFFFFLKADREDGEPQHEDESSESDEEEEELENKKVSLFDESKFYLRVTSAQNCHVLAQNRNEYKKIKANVETLNFSSISRQLEIWAK